MTWSYWFVLTLVLQFDVQVEGITTGVVVCNSNHTVTITITNVLDIAEFNASDWRIGNNTQCDPTFSGTTVTYSNLQPSTCATTSEERSNDILYIFKIRPVSSGSGTTQAFDHQYDASCAFNNTVNSTTVTADFIPITNRGNNDSDTAFFTFTLGVFTDASLNTVLSSEVALNQTLYFKALVVTAGAAPNLDLFILSCHASKSIEPSSADGKVVLIENGCGNDTVSTDVGDTVLHTCADNSKQESFSVRSFRYFGAEANTNVWVHCEFKVCLADTPNSECECPTLAECDPNSRKRRSVPGSEVYRLTVGPYYFVEEKEVEEDDRFDKENTRIEDKEPFFLNLTIILAISGVVITAIICVTMFLLMRNRKQRFSISESSKTHDLNAVKT